MRRVKLKDRKKVRLRNRPPKRTAPDRLRQVWDEHMTLRPVTRPAVPAHDWPRCQSCGDFAINQYDFVCERAACQQGRAPFAEYIKKDPPPDLQDLVKEHGSFMAIPPAAWLKWDQELRSWQARVRTRQWDR